MAHGSFVIAIQSVQINLLANRLLQKIIITY
jgi:hypothetical protein